MGNQAKFVVALVSLLETVLVSVAGSKGGPNLKEWNRVSYTRIDSCTPSHQVKYYLN